MGPPTRKGVGSRDLCVCDETPSRSGQGSGWCRSRAPPSDRGRWASLIRLADDPDIEAAALVVVAERDLLLARPVAQLDRLPQVAADPAAHGAVGLADRHRRARGGGGIGAGARLPRA